MLRTMAVIAAAVALTAEGGSHMTEAADGHAGGLLLVANKGGLYYVASDLSVTSFQQYCSVGSGADFAMGAAYILYPTELGAEEIARRCVETSSAFNLYCGGSVEMLEVK